MSFLEAGKRGRVAEMLRYSPKLELPHLDSLTTMDESRANLRNAGKLGRAIRVVICDDERLALEYLAKLLRAQDGIDLVGIASDGVKAVGMIAQLEPDLVLLDVEMPVCDGFDVVQRIAGLRLDEPPIIGFVTAYRRFAPQAFETGAIDFLTKPVRVERLEVTLRRTVEALLDRESRRRLSELEAMLPSFRADVGLADAAHLWVSKRGEMVRVDLDRIERIAAEGPYSRLFVGGASFLHREGISEMALRLPSDFFLRVHRSHLVRRDQVRAIRRTMHGAPELVMADGERVPVGRKFAGDVRNALTDR